VSYRVARDKSERASERESESGSGRVAGWPGERAGASEKATERGREWKRERERERTSDRTRDKEIFRLLSFIRRCEDGHYERDPCLLAELREPNPNLFLNR
jgi:IS5 family transposase